MNNALPPEIATELLDILPNPVLVKNKSLEYVWVNRAFEGLFGVDRQYVAGKLDKELFPERQVAQCSGGDLRVLNNGEIDEAVETVFDPTGAARETITRKSRLAVSNAEVYLIGVMHDVTDVVRTNAALKQSQKKLEEQALKLAILANTDTMTGCANRRQLEDCEQELLQNAEKTSAVLAIDIDHFKSINDTHGHNYGDSAIKHFCALTRSLLNAPNSKFIRLGGEEFAVVITNCTYDAARHKAEEIRSLVKNTPLIIKDKVLRFTISIGVAFKAEDDIVRIDDMLRTADANLYKAKKSGRNTVVMPHRVPSGALNTGS